MLVLSRRANETISLPELGVTLHFIRIQSGTVKIGVEAPPDVQIVRDELDPDAAEAAEAQRKESVRLPRDLRHAVRNQLNTALLGLHLFREQMQRGQADAANNTFEMITAALDSLDNNPAFQAPGDEREEREPTRVTPR